VLRRPLEPKQYLAIRYTERLAEAGAVTSVGSRGDSYDNALAETIIGLYKTELIRRRGPWKGIDQVEYATLEWVDWFNHRRLPVRPASDRRVSIGVVRWGKITAIAGAVGASLSSCWGCHGGGGVQRQRRARRPCVP